MKKLFKFSLLALFMAVASCEDATDIVQPSELNDETAFRTLADLQSGLLGVYNAYTPDNANNGVGDAFFFSDVFTDNVQRSNDNLGQGSEEFNFILQPGSSSARIIWGNRYGTINFANRVLRAWNRIVPSLTQSEMQEANRIKGELLAMRALAHFDLLQYYTEDYSDRTSPGVINMNFVPNIDEVFPRNTVGENFDFINADLTEASTLLGDFTPGSDVPFFVNEDVVKAIRARVALFEGNYTLAETLSNELVDDYPLSTSGEYIDMWDDTALESSEAIFVLSRLVNDTEVGANWYTNSVDQNGAPLLFMSSQLFNLYENWDIRGRGFEVGQGVFVDEDSDIPNGIILIGKYPGDSPGGQLINHIKLFRSSEMLLIRAECEARRGDFTAAAASIHELWVARQRPGMFAPAQPVFGGANPTVQALTMILLERRKELAFEGHRYLDLKRLGRELNIGISRDASDCASFSALQCSLAPTDYRFTLPIPTTEVTSNPTIQQNTGY